MAIAGQQGEFWRPWSIGVAEKLVKVLEIEFHNENRTNKS